MHSMRASPTSSSSKALTVPAALDRGLLQLFCNDALAANGYVRNPEDANSAPSSTVARMSTIRSSIAASDQGRLWTNTSREIAVRSACALGRRC